MALFDSIQRVSEDEVPSLTRNGSGGTMSAERAQLGSFLASLAKGERVATNVTNVQQFSQVLRLALNDVRPADGLAIRYQLENVEKVRQNRKGETLTDLGQPGRVFFWVKDKAEGRGRKPAAKPAATGKRGK